MGCAIAALDLTFDNLVNPAINPPAAPPARAYCRLIPYTLLTLSLSPHRSCLNLYPRRRSIIWLQRHVHSG